MNTHLHPLRAKRPSLGTNSVANRYFAGQRPYCVVTKAGDSQINKTAAAFGAILYTVITGDSVVSALTNIINRALNTNV
jgi:hypothetical protein